MWLASVNRTSRLLLQLYHSFSKLEQEPVLLQVFLAGQLACLTSTMLALIGSRSTMMVCSYVVKSDIFYKDFMTYICAGRCACNALMGRFQLKH